MILGVPPWLRNPVETCHSSHSSICWKCWKCWNPTQSLASLAQAWNSAAKSVASPSFVPERPWKTHCVHAAVGCLWLHWLHYSFHLNSLVTEEKRFEWALGAALTLIIVDLLVAFCVLFPSVSICFMFGHISLWCLLLGLKGLFAVTNISGCGTKGYERQTPCDPKVKIGKILIDQVGKERCTVLLLAVALWSMVLGSWGRRNFDSNSLICCLTV